MKNKIKTVSRTPAKTSKVRLTSTEKINAITKRLRRGDFTAIAKLTGYDNTHVSRVLKGISANPSGEIVNATFARVKSRKVIA